MDGCFKTALDLLGSRSEHSRELSQQTVNPWLGFERPAFKERLSGISKALITDIHTVGVNSSLTFSFLPTNIEKYPYPISVSQTCISSSHQNPLIMLILTQLTFTDMIMVDVVSRVFSEKRSCWYVREFSLYLRVRELFRATFIDKCFTFIYSSSFMDIIKMFCFLFIVKFYAL